MAKAKKRVQRSATKRSERGRKVANNGGGWFAALMESQTGRTIAAEVLIAAAGAAGKACSGTAWGDSVCCVWEEIR